MVRAGHDLDLIDPEKIVPVAMTVPQAINTRNAGRFSPLDFETTETDENNAKATQASATKQAPPPTVDDPDPR